MRARKEAARLQLEEVARVAAEIEAGRDVAMPAGGQSDGVSDSLAANGVLPQHRGKTGAVWAVYNLSEEKPSCTVMEGDHVCGAVPAPTGGTSNYWSHLSCHHRAVWLQLKQGAGLLTGSGEEELKALSKQLTDFSNKNSLPDQAVFSTLPADATAVLDRVLVDWIIDTDGNLNEGEGASLRHLLSVASNHAYSGAGRQKVAGLMTQSAESGRAIATQFHTKLLADGIKPSISGDLWSKKGAALLGLMSHGVVEVPRPDGRVDWEMREVLAGAVPCANEHHTGSHVDELSNAAWKSVGIPNPIKDIFKRKSDEGSNMIKVIWIDFECWF